MNVIAAAEASEANADADHGRFVGVEQVWNAAECFRLVDQQVDVVLAPGSRMNKFDCASNAL